MGSDGSNSRRLTVVGGWSPSWSPDGQHLVFLSRRDGNEEIYVMELRQAGSDGDGSDGDWVAGEDWVAGTIRLRRLTAVGGVFPSWSPDGRHIAFVSDRAGNEEIYVMGSDGSNPRNLTDHSDDDGSPSWSPDGRHIAFVSDRAGNEEIYVMGSDGSNPRNLTDHSDDDGSPSWSPDGRHIAFVSDRAGNEEIYVMGSDGSNPRNLTDHSDDDGSPSWSPDGRHIAFVSDRAGNREIYVMGSDGSNPRRLTDHSYSDWDPSWSPDGRHIAFVSKRGRAGDEEIYVMGSDGSNPRRLTSYWELNNVRYLSWSPDGRHIAFVSDPDVGNREIYVMGSDGSNPRRLTAAGGWSPSWSPNGQHIAFVSGRDSWGGEIYVMELSQVGSQSGSDGDDSPATAVPVAVGTSIEGDLWAADDIDYFRVTVANTGILIASTTGYTDTYDVIEDSSGNVLNKNDGGGAGRNFHVSAAVEPGTYYIRVSGIRHAGTYTLTLHLDEDGSPALAVPVAVGTSIEGDLWGADDIDYFRVNMTNAGWLIASTTGYTDTYGVIEDSSGNVLDENDGGGAGRNFRVSVIVEPGTYYIRVRGFTGAYTLTLQIEESPDGINLRNLTNHPAWDQSPSWSPDGRHIAFVSDRDGDYNSEIYVIDSDGSNLRRLTDLDSQLPSWSPDGRHIAFFSSEDIYVMDSDGSNLRRLTKDIGWPWEWEEVLSLKWSPDGRRIAFVSELDKNFEDFKNFEIYVVGSDGRHLRNLTNHRARDAFPSWSPDGRHIAFVSDRDGNVEIYVMDSDGGNPRNLTDHWANDAFPSWSPDGRHIAFASDRDGDSEVYVMGSDGSNPRRLTDHSATDRSPSWSPDGRHIAFVSGRDGDSEVYVMGSDGSNPRRLTNHSVAWYAYPSWSPDGRHIAFVSDPDDAPEIYVIDLEADSGGGR